MAAAINFASVTGNAGSSTGDVGLISGDGTWAARAAWGSTEDMYFEGGGFPEMLVPRIDAMAMG